MPTGADTFSFKLPIRAAQDGTDPEQCNVDLGGNWSANKVLAGPVVGADAIPSARTLVNADLPSTITQSVIEADKLGIGPDIESLTISGGYITVSTSHCVVYTEGAAASDTLDGIYGGRPGQLLVVEIAAPLTESVIISHNTGGVSTRIWCPSGQNLTLDAAYDQILLVYHGLWFVLGYLLATLPPPAAHALGGAQHSADTLANLNSKVSNADVVALAGHLGGTPSSPTVVNHAVIASGDLHTEYVREAETNWVDLTDGGATSLHTHPTRGVIPFGFDLGGQAFNPQP